MGRVVTSRRESCVLHMQPCSQTVERSRSRAATIARGAFLPSLALSVSHCFPVQPRYHHTYMSNEWGDVDIYRSCIHLAALQVSWIASPTTVFALEDAPGLSTLPTTHSRLGPHRPIKHVRPQQPTCQAQSHIHEQRFSKFAESFSILLSLIHI